MPKLKNFPFEPKYHEDFVNLSLEWLTKYKLFEEADKVMLENPTEIILKKGGHIILFGYGDKVVGTVALKKIDAFVFELLKLGVKQAYQRQGIGRELMSYGIKWCKENGAKKIVLETNKKLENAITLYKKFNFKEIDLTDMSYSLSNVKMELYLNKLNYE